MTYKYYLFMILVAIVFLGCPEDEPLVDPNTGKPTVAIINPSNNSVIFDSVSVHINATDDKGVNQVALFIDSLSFPARIFTAPPYIHVWDASAYPDSSSHIMVANAIDDDGNTANSSIITVLIRLFAPSDLHSTFMDDEKIYLAWNDNCLFETGYEIQLSTDGVNFTSVDTTGINSTTGRVDYSFALFTQYYFRIRALTDTSASKFSNVLSTELQLLSPGTLQVTGITDSSVELRWEDRNLIEDNFEIEASDAGPNFTQIMVVPANTISATINYPFTRGSNYDFRVRATAGDTVSRYSTRARLYYSTSMYAGGDFTNINDVDVRKISEWNGVSWLALGNGLNSTVSAMQSYNNELYVGGSFSTAGTSSASNIARWNGFEWKSIGTGTNGRVLALAIYNDELYIAGSFTSAGEVSVNNIAKWNGTSWSAVGNGLNGVVNTLEVYRYDLFAGGNFVTSGSDTVNRLALWNGTNWRSIGKGMSGEVFTLKQANGDIYIAGDFLSADTLPVGRVVSWGTFGFDSVGDGFNGKVYTLGYHEGNVLAGGEFSLSGNDYVRKTGRFNGSFWTEIGFNGLAGDVYAYSSYENALYAGENLSSNKRLVSNRIVVLDGTNVWKSVGGGITGKIRVLYNHSSWHWEILP